MTSTTTTNIKTQDAMPLIIDRDITEPLPPTIPFHAAGVPADLKPRKWFLVYKLVPYRKADGTIKFSKVPYSAVGPDERKASTTDPSTWATFNQCLEWMDLAPGRYHGIGVVLQDLLGVDFDRVRTAPGGPLDPAARRLISRLDSYTETSVSGLGEKTLVYASMEPMMHRLGVEDRRDLRNRVQYQGIEIEVYDRSSPRFFALTGNHVDWTPATVEQRQVAFENLYEEVFGPAIAGARTTKRKRTEARATFVRNNPLSLNVDSTKVVEVAQHDRKWLDLFEGRWTDVNGADGKPYPSQSEADMGFLTKTYFYAGPDGEEIVEELWRASDLFRPVKDRPSYVRSSIHHAGVRAARDGEFFNWDHRVAAQKLDAQRDAVLRLAKEAGKISGEKPAPPPPAEPRDEYDNKWPPLQLGKLPEALPFPIDVLPGPLRDLAEASASAVGCPVDYSAVYALAAAGATIGNFTTLQQEDNFFHRPALWVLGVGLPSSGRSPALNMAAAPTIKMEMQAHEDNQLALLLHEDALSAWEESPKKDRGPKPVIPKPTRYRIVHSTMEKVGHILAQNPRGIIMIQDEIIALVESLNQYRGGHGSDMAHYLTIFANEPTTIDRVKDVGGIPLHIEVPFMAIAGNVTTSNLPRMVGKSGDSGWLERWLIAFPEDTPTVRYSDRVFLPDAVRDRYQDFLLHVHKVCSTPRVVHFSPEGHDLLREVMDANADETNDPFFPKLQLTSWWKKYETYTGRLALILAVLEDPENPLVTPDILARAWTLIVYFKQMSRRVLAELESVGRGAPTAVAAIIEFISQHPDMGYISVSQVGRCFHAKRLKELNRAKVEVAFDWLERNNVIRPTEAPDAGAKKRGRPTDALYEINPTYKDHLNRK